MISPYFAYIGPGAGFAFLGSFLTLLLSVLASITSLLLWPLRMLRLAIRRHRGRRPARIRKLIFLGLDGLDPELTEKELNKVTGGTTGRMSSSSIAVLVGCPASAFTVTFGPNKTIVPRPP